LESLDAILHLIILVAVAPALNGLEALFLSVVCFPSSDLWLSLFSLYVRLKHGCPIVAFRDAGRLSLRTTTIAQMLTRIRKVALMILLFASLLGLSGVLWMHCGVVAAICRWRTLQYCLLHLSISTFE